MKRRSGENATNFTSHKRRVPGLFCNSLLFHFLFSFFIVSTSYRLDFPRFLEFSLRSSQRKGYTRERQSMSVT